MTALHCYRCGKKVGEVFRFIAVWHGGPNFHKEPVCSECMYEHEWIHEQGRRPALETHFGNTEEGRAVMTD